MKEPLRVNGGPTGAVSVLSVSPIEEDHACLERAFGRPDWTLYSNSEWTLRRSTTLESALAELRKYRIPVVICERDLPPDSWTNLLEQTASLTDPPSLVVTARLADDQLWAQALNLGAYDVLAKPFDEQEVIRTLSLAWIHWAHSRSGRTNGVARRA